MPPAGTLNSTGFEICTVRLAAMLGERAELGFRSNMLTKCRTTQAVGNLPGCLFGECSKQRGDASCLVAVSVPPVDALPGNWSPPLMGGVATVPGQERGLKEVFAA